MNATIINMPWMSKARKKENCLSMKATSLEMKGCKYLIVDTSLKKPFFRLVLTEKSFEVFFPEEITVSFRYGHRTFKQGQAKMKISKIFDWPVDELLKDVSTDKESEEAIISFCGKGNYSYSYSPDWYIAIKCKQQSILDAVASRAWDRRREKLHAATDCIKEPTKAFINWCHKQVEHHFLYTYPFKGKKESTGICSHCGKEITIKKGEVLKRCPECKVKLEYTRKRSISFTKEDCILIQKINNAFYQRHFGVQVNIGIGYETYNVWEKGCVRVDLTTGEKHNYFRKYDCWNRKLFWDDCNLGYMNQIKLCPGAVYSTADITKEPQFKYSGIEYLDNVDPFDYLARYTRMPQLEMLAKLGMKNLALNIQPRDMATEYKKPWEMLKVNKEEFNRMQKTNPTIAMLAWYQYENEKGIRIDDEDIAFLSKFSCPSQFDFIYPLMSYKQIRNYLEAQLSNMQFPTYYSLIIKWSDYIDMGNYFGKDMTLEMNYRPKNVCAAHDELAGLKRAEKEAEFAKQREDEIANKFPSVRDILPTLKKYEFSDGVYEIIAPESIMDIVKEGQILGHCLDRTDRYWDRISRHESYIVFLRKVENRNAPFYTLEIEPNGTTRQKRTYGDRQDEDYTECVDFIKKWQRQLKKKLSSSDKERSVKSAELREAEFKELRERQEKVWHGLLAGQLLADVLQADLMLA